MEPSKPIHNRTKALHLEDTVSSKTFSKGQIIFLEGDFANSNMYFIFSGELGIYKFRNNVNVKIGVLSNGEFFGEMALMNNNRRSATVKVESESAKLGEISKDNFLQLANNSPAFLFRLLRNAISRLKNAEYKLNKQVEHHPVFLKDNLKIDNTLLKGINTLEYIDTIPSSLMLKDQVVYSEGDESDGSMYFILYGEVSEYRNTKDIEMSVTILKKGEFFGEVGLIEREKRTSTFRILSSQAKIARINRSIFLKLCHNNAGFLYNVIRLIFAKLNLCEEQIKSIEAELQKER